MKVTSISRKAFERLERMQLSRNVRNTEAVIYDYSTRLSPTQKVFKKLHHQNGPVFGNKLFTLEMLDSNKDHLPPYFCIPDSLVTVGGVVQGFTLPKISLDPSLQSVLLKEDLMISTCMMATCLKLTKFAYPSLLFESYYCKSHMEVASWDTLDGIRHLRC
jgi:hypothetical protein